MSVPPLSKSIGWTRGIVEGRNMMLDLQRQLATGRKATTYGGLGPERSLALSARARISAIGAFQATIQTVDLRLKVMNQALDRFVELGREIKADAASPSYELTAGDRTAFQVRAENALDEALSLLRSDVAGRHLFAGHAVDTNPVAGKSAILQGEGGRDGFQQVLGERKQADLGDGLGRLELDLAGDVVTFGEDHAGPFGFKITALSTSMAGAAVTPPGGTPPEAGIALAGATPQPGDKVRLTLAMPDGTEAVVELIAAAPGAGGPGMFEIGADADETAANLHAALGGAIREAAATKLAAASGYAAAEDFFNYSGSDGPRRVNADATGYRDGSDDTVLWYKGDTAEGDPRLTAQARIDDQITVSYGARANEEALRLTIQNLAVLAAETFDAGVAADKERYKEMTSRVVKNFAYTDGRASPESLQAQIAAQHHTLGKAKERHGATMAMAQDLLAQVEEADPNEVAVKLLQLHTRLQASYETTAMLAQMSLVYHL